MMLFQKLSQTGTLNPEQMQVLGREMASRTHRKHIVWSITEAIIARPATCQALLFGTALTTAAQHLRLGDEVFASKQKAHLQCRAQAVPRAHAKMSLSTGGSRGHNHVGTDDRSSNLQMGVKWGFVIRVWFCLCGLWRGASAGAANSQLSPGLRPGDAWRWVCCRCLPRQHGGRVQLRGVRSSVGVILHAASFRSLRRGLLVAGLPGRGSVRSAGRRDSRRHRGVPGLGTEVQLTNWCC
jgi:hypothetical protein